jgi:hypothetical protein
MDGLMPQIKELIMKEPKIAKFIEKRNAAEQANKRPIPMGGLKPIKPVTSVKGK